MPGVPMRSRRDTVMVLKVMALAPARSAPAATRRASSSMCILHGVKLLHVEANAYWGLVEVASTKPTRAAWIGWAPALRHRPPSVNKRRVSMAGDFFGMPFSLRNAVAFDQVTVRAAQRLSLGTDTSPRAIFRIPGVQVDMHPRRFGHEKRFKNKRAENRTGKCRGCDIVQIGDLLESSSS